MGGTGRRSHGAAQAGTGRGLCREAGAAALGQGGAVGPAGGAAGEVRRPGEGPLRLLCPRLDRAQASGSHLECPVGSLATSLWETLQPLGRGVWEAQKAGWSKTGCHGPANLRGREALATGAALPGSAAAMTGARELGWGTKVWQLRAVAPEHSRWQTPGEDKLH